MLYSLARPLLFTLPPEQAHTLAMRALEYRLAACGLSAPPVTGASAVTVMGLPFANPVGLAAGFDKNGAHIDALATLGFGFIEIGGVTPKPQPGNPKPRIFRLPEADALINRMGFNNIGAKAVATNLNKRRYRGIVGINLGKNADTPAEETTSDYLSLLKQLYPYADFFVINVSSPNTQNLREWQHGDKLRALLTAVRDQRDELAAQHNHSAPLAVKIAPDMESDELHTIADIITDCGIAGVVAVNTTTERPAAVSALAASRESGGLSGRPLAERATAVIRKLRELLPPDIAIIGVGGIDSAAAAREKFAAGANLIQLYTGLIYRGSGLPMEIIRALRADNYKRNENRAGA